MDIFNGVVDFLFNILFIPFKNVNPVWGMLVASFLTGIVMLLIFKTTSDQEGIKKAKNLVKAHFLAIRLYRDDLSLMFGTMKNILLSNLHYMQKSLRPMMFLILPVGLILIHLGTRYEYRPFKVGETTILSLRLDRKTTLAQLGAIKLELPEGLSTEIAPVRIEELNEINWRIKAEKPGKYELVFNLDGKRIKKRLQVVNQLVAVTSRISRDSFTTTLMNPGEPSLPGSLPVTAISVAYPKRDFKLLGITMHWLVAFFVLSLIFGFSFKGILGVQL
ncbi:MAG: hypothetical protein ACE5HX_09830 [bacterium]